MVGLYNQIDDSNIVLIKDEKTSFNILMISDFLTKEEREEIFLSLCKNKDEFYSCGDEISTSHLFLKDKSSNINIDLLNKSCDVLSDRILKLMPDIFTILDIEPFLVSKIRFNFIQGLDGHYGDPHSDDYGMGLKITLLYYFHLKPKSFSGGDLEFYDNLENKNIIKKIDYEDNLFIAFPADKVHGVSKVSCDSKNFENGRFVGVTFIGENKS